MILVFGSINVDVIVPVPHLPQPGETVLGGDYAVLPGGKGANQAMAACRAGADVVMAGAVGRDGFAATALDPLSRAGIDTRLVRAVDRPTGCAAIMVGESGENIIAVASGANAAVRCGQVPGAMLGPQTLLVAQMEVPPGETATDDPPGAGGWRLCIAQSGAGIGGRARPIARDRPCRGE